jgi:hypothetical protein
MALFPDSHEQRLAGMKQPMNGQVSADYSVEKPDVGIDWQLQLQLQFLFPK